MLATHEFSPTPGATGVMREDRTSRVMRILTQLDPSVTYKMMQLFLMVADAHPKGILQSDLVGKIDKERVNVSRWVRRFGSKTIVRVDANKVKRIPALGLIHAQIAPFDTRAHLLTLTAQGVKVKARIDERGTI